MSGTHERAIARARKDKRWHSDAYREAMFALDRAVVAALRAGESAADVAAWSNYDPKWVARLAEMADVTRPCCDGRSGTVNGSYYGVSDPAELFIITVFLAAIFLVLVVVMLELILARLRSPR